jgi:hypothetical protein
MMGALRPYGPGKATRAKIAEHVDMSRRWLVDGVTRKEYPATVEVLQRMAASLVGRA